MRIASFAACVLLSCAPVQSEVDPRVAQYATAVVAYQHGDFETAATTVTAWPASVLQRIVALSLAEEHSTWDARRLKAAAMLHAELVLRRKVERTSDLVVQFDVGDRLVHAL